MSRFSFRQLWFAAFILIAGVLTASSVQALLTLESLARLGRDGARQAVTLTEQSQRLAERTQAMERSARQFLVLDDAQFRERYFAAWRQADAALQALAAALPGLAPALADEWRVHGDAAWAELQGGHRRALAQAALVRAFARLPVLNDSLAQAGKREIERRNDALLAELERQRRLLAASVAGAALLAVLLAAGFGYWLSRPLRRIESAIGRLGANRLDQPVEVGGPADTRRVGAQLDWLRRRLAELDADKQRFLRHISHELKTPLSALREGVALIEDEVAGPLSGGQREIAAILRQNTAALQAQIEDLLRCHAAAFDAQRARRVPVDLLALLRRVVEEQRLQWQARGLRVSVHGAPLSGLADADQLAAACANILSNALRFSPEGGAVRFELKAGPSALTIDCIDQGPGVAPQDAARIFEPFYQGARQPSGARSGNGIGLSIVREYIAGHGGSISLLASGAGAHFRIELPYDA